MTYMNAIIKTLITASLISLSTPSAWANCVRQVDHAPLGVCYNEYGEIEDNRNLANGMLGALVGASKNKTPTKPRAPADPTENVNAPFEGTRDFLFERSNGCQALNLIDHRLRITIEPLRSEKVHLIVHEVDPDAQVNRVYDGFLFKIGKDVGFQSSGFNTIILNDSLFVESADANTAVQCKAIESSTRTKNTIKGILQIVDIFRKH